MNSTGVNKVQLAMNNVFSYRCKSIFLSLFIVLFVSACGGGSSGGGSESTTQSVSGGAVKGPLVDAIVTVYAFDAALTGFKGAVVDTAVTDSNAAISGLDLPLPLTPPYIMEFTVGASTTDMTTGVTPVISTLRTVITQALLDSGEPIYATPSTTMAVDLAVSKADSNVAPWIGDNDSTTTKVEFLAALPTAADYVTSTLGFGLDGSVDIFATPSLINDATNTADAQAQVAAYRTAIETTIAMVYQIQQLSTGVSADAILTEITADLADDGIINGTAGTAINANTLQVLQQAPSSLLIPTTSSTPLTATIADIQDILVAEAQMLFPSVDVTAIDTGGTVTTVPKPVQVNVDIDGDNTLNVRDLFPFDGLESADADGDGEGDVADTDDDNDGALDTDDDYPADATRFLDPVLDRDNDTVPNASDNCPLNANTNQADTNTNGLGDACDDDADGDGVPNDGTDNCPLNSNPSQINTGGSAAGDVCDPDIDGDGTVNIDDAFPFDILETTDSDGDGEGDVADTDDDNDGLSDIDEAAAGSNPLDSDTDDDGVLDGADFDPTNPAVTINFAPVAVDDNATAGEDASTFSITVTANDTDDDGNPNDVISLTAIGTNNAALGTAVINGNDIDYTPVANASGVDTFSYTITDGNAIATGMVIVTITAVNDNPVAVDDSATTNEDSAITTVNVTTNDSDVEGDTLSASLLANASNGNVVDNANGTFTYTPNANFNGADSFTYTLSDGNGGSTNATVNITISAVNDNPAAMPDALTTAEDTANTTIDVTANDLDVDSITLSVDVGNPTADNGMVANNNDGTFTYTPNTDFNGSDSFNYGLSDGNGGSATGTVNVTVTAVNDAPVAVDDSATTNEDNAVTTVDVTTNDSDVDGDTLSASLLANASNGAVVDNGNGTFTYTPNANFNGADSFTYTLSDGNGGNTTATVSLTITAVNDAPVAVADALSINEDTASLLFDVTANDSDEEGDTLSASLLANASNGNVVGSGNGSFTYTPNANFNGADSFSYTLSDGNGGSATGVVNVTVNPVNDDPQAVIDAFPAAVSTLTVLNVLANDTDVDGDALTITGVSVGSRSGTITTNGATVSFTDITGISGTETFTYDISDGNGGTVTSTLVTVTVTANIPPVATADAGSTNEDTLLTTVNVLTNDTDGGDGPAAITVSAFDAISANGGAVANNGDGTFNYTPATDYFGSDTFTYTVSDSVSTAVGTVTITVNSVNDAPLAVSDSATTAEDTFVTTVNVLNNDTDGGGVDGPSVLSVSAVDALSVQGGVIANNGDGTFNYTPTANYFGNDSFTYSVSDGEDSSLATVFVNVTAVNDAPVAVDDDATTEVDTAFTTGNVLTNDTDVENDSLAISAADAISANGGTVVNNTNGTFTYTPPTSFIGTDTFDYTVSDSVATDVGTVTVTVAELGDVATLTSLLDMTNTIDGGGVGALEGVDEGLPQYESWRDTYSPIGSPTGVFSYADKIYDYNTQTFVTRTFNDELFLNQNGTWGAASATVDVITANHGDGSMTISVKNAGDTEELVRERIRARTLDLSGELISDYLSVDWQNAMFSPTATFTAGALHVNSYTFETLIDKYSIDIEDWCEAYNLAQYKALNENCNGIPMDDFTRYAATLNELISLGAWVDPDDGTDTGLTAFWLNFNNATTSALLVELVQGNTVNFYVRDYLAATQADQYTLLLSLTSGWSLSTIRNHQMLQITLPQSLQVQFPDLADEPMTAYLAEQNGAVRVVSTSLAGETEGETDDGDIILNGLALDQVLANFNGPAASSLDPLVGTWVNNSPSSNNGDKPLLHIFSNGYFEMTGTCDANNTTGLEHGTLVWDQPSGLYLAEASVNERGQCGLVALGGNGETLSVSDDNLTLSTGSGNEIYTRLETSWNRLEGSWIGGDITANGEQGHFMFTFLNDGSFFMAQDCDAGDGSFGESEGFEFGTYNWDPEGSGSLTGTINLDGNGSCGFNNFDDPSAVPTALPSLNVAVDFNTLTANIVGEPPIVLTRQSSSCGYESGWDDNTETPINPNSFAEYEKVLADCGSAQAFNTADIAGSTTVSSGFGGDPDETTAFSNTNAPAPSAPFDAGASDWKSGNVSISAAGGDPAENIDFVWRVEAASCSGCTHSYLVLYTDSGIDADLPFGLWVRDTVAIEADGPIGVSGTTYSVTGYYEESSYSNTNRALGSDAEIWHSDEVVQ